MYDSIEEHIKEVEEWLKENVKVYGDPASITLSQFEVDWEEFRGSFVLALDDDVIEERMRFFLLPEGRVRFISPMFHSPSALLHLMRRMSSLGKHMMR